LEAVNFGFLVSVAWKFKKGAKNWALIHIST
jgi:hypothetical protein